LANEKLRELEERMYQKLEDAGNFEGIFPHSMEDSAGDRVYSSVLWTGGYIDSFESRKEALIEKTMSSSGTAYEAELVAKELKIYDCCGEYRRLY